MTSLSWLLMWFEGCSGLRINLEKSELIPMGKVDNIDDLTLELGWKVNDLPCRYLGWVEVKEDSEGFSLGWWSSYAKTPPSKVEDSLFREKEWGEGGGLGVRKLGWRMFRTPKKKGGGWTPRFSKPFNDWEMESVKRFLMKLHAKRVHSDVEDKVIWTSLEEGELFDQISLFCFGAR
ncbi:hypothetical protein CK203_033009 [Vitis vinifera]|uniref:Reverse transcriptase domain-containing protein n=1 Tax=Vitis vinifera TaxID=29760 RepID=A0A438HVU7_VITVI|nr:hypothetical protein CK203_033009 [Vitis vinifera]